MRSVMLFSTMALTMSAQTLVGLPDLKVGLEGNFDVPVVVNNSDRSIIGYGLHIEDDTVTQTNIPVYRLEGIPSGAADAFIRVDDLETARAAGRQAMPRDVHKDGSPVVVSRISLDWVIFANGEFAGPDAAQFYRFAVAHIDAVRSFAGETLSDMARVETMARASHGSSLRDRVYRRGNTGEQMIAAAAEDQLAEEVFRVQQESGIEAARAAVYRLSKTPKLWKGQKNEAAK